MSKGSRIHVLMTLPMALIAVPCTASAANEVRFGADASASVGYSTNPFSEPTKGTGSAFGEIRLSPKLSLVNEHSVFTLSATGQYQRYSRLYGNSFSYGTGLDYSGRPSERIKSHLYVNYDSSVVGGSNFVSEVIDPTLPLQPLLFGTDISLFGTRDRRSTLRGGGDLTYALSARDQLGASAFYFSSRYSRLGALGNNDGYGGSLGYSRQVTEHLQLGGQMGVARYDYKGSLGSTTVLSPQLSFAWTLGPRWKADGAVGVSFASATNGRTGRSLSGNLRLCRASERSSLCLAAQRAVLPTGISGTQNVTSADANYSYKVSERGTISASAGYSSNASSQLLAANDNEYLRGSISYEHVLRERVRVIVSSQYRKIFGGLTSRSADVGGRVGIVIRLGDIR